MTQLEFKSIREQDIPHGNTEIISVGPVQLVINRSLQGRIEHVQPLVEGDNEFIDSKDGILKARGELGSIEIQTKPPQGLERKRSGHDPIPENKQLWVVDIVTAGESCTTTIPVIRKTFDRPTRITAQENKTTQAHPLIPFRLEVAHPDLDAEKTDILSIVQIFGHISAAARMMEALPPNLRGKTSLAARNIENVPKVMQHLEQMGCGKKEDLIPLTYEDGASGGQHITERVAAVWWLAQNPEVMDRFMRSKVIISDLREETALLKHIADCMNLPQIFLGLTFAWPQHLDQVLNIHPKLKEAFDAIPSVEEKLDAMEEVGLGASDAVPDWFSWARDWKAGVRGNHAFAADAMISFSLVSPKEIPAGIDNAIIFPPRTHLENNGHGEKLWNQTEKRVLVLMGSGDWTERELFVTNMLEAALLLPECEVLLVGPFLTDARKALPGNVKTLGYVTPDLVDSLIKSCSVAVIKPGHFSLEETAGTLTLIAPPDNVERSVEISKKAGNPRSVAITVEVVEERLTTAIEKWIELGKPADFSPLLDIRSKESIASSVTQALTQLNRFKPTLDKTPQHGTNLLVDILSFLMGSSFNRKDIPAIIEDIKQAVEAKWK